MKQKSQKPVTNSENPGLQHMAEVRSCAKENIEFAANLLRAGGLVSFPTETVYGLGANAFDAEAVARIFSAKGRPSFNPLIVHVASLETASELVELSEKAIKIANKFWPGALTIVAKLRSNANISSLVTAGLDTLAVRVPVNDSAQQLLSAVGLPIAAPSANSSGQISPTRAQHVAHDLGGKVDLILDGGACDVGVESTIISEKNGDLYLLRPGGISREAIEELADCKIKSVENPKEINAPGQMLSHYAPSKPLRLNATFVNADEALLAFGKNMPVGYENLATIKNLSENSDLVEAAANLFDYLHLLDSGPEKKLAAMPVPFHGLGEAINDRLQRAAADKIG